MEEFDKLNATLNHDTMHLSNPTLIVSHHAYLSIVALGKAVIPSLLADVKLHRGHWCPALRALTGENPVPDGVTNSAEQRRLWLEWGEQKGYILPRESERDHDH